MSSDDGVAAGSPGEVGGSEQKVIWRPRERSPERREKVQEALKHEAVPPLSASAEPTPKRVLWSGKTRSRTRPEAVNLAPTFFPFDLLFEDAPPTASSPAGKDDVSSDDVAEAGSGESGKKKKKKDGFASATTSSESLMMESILQQVEARSSALIRGDSARKYAAGSAIKASPINSRASMLTPSPFARISSSSSGHIPLSATRTPWGIERESATSARKRPLEGRSSHGGGTLSPWLLTGGPPNFSPQPASNSWLETNDRKSKRVRADEGESFAWELVQKVKEESDRTRKFEEMLAKMVAEGESEKTKAKDSSK